MNNDLHLRITVSEHVKGIQSVYPRHIDIHDYNIRTVFPHACHKIHAVGHAGKYPEIRKMIFQQCFQSYTFDRFVIRDQNSIITHSHFCGSFLLCASAGKRHCDLCPHARNTFNLHLCPAMEENLKPCVYIRKPQSLFRML